MLRIKKIQDVIFAEKANQSKKAYNTVSTMELKKLITTDFKGKLIKIAKANPLKKQLIISPKNQVQTES